MQCAGTRLRGPSRWEAQIQCGELLFGTVDLGFHIFIERGIEQVIVETMVVNPQRVGA